MKIALTSDTHYGFDHNTHRIHEKFLKRLADEKPELVIHAGDWGSNQQINVQKSMRMFRKFLGNTPIVAVLGNHDWWSDDFKMESNRSYESLKNLHREFFKESNIHYLDEMTPCFLSNLMIIGFDGWYWDSDPPTNDIYHMFKDVDGVPTHQFMSRHAHERLSKLLEWKPHHTEKVIGVTHFPPFTENPIYEKLCGNTSYMGVLTEKCEILCVGHSHRKADFMHGNCQVLNAGSNYNAPQYLIFEI